MRVVTLKGCLNMGYNITVVYKEYDRSRIWVLTQLTSPCPTFCLLLTV